MSLMLIAYMSLNETYYSHQVVSNLIKKYVFCILIMVCKTHIQITGPYSHTQTLSPHN